MDKRIDDLERKLNGVENELTDIKGNLVDLQNAVNDLTQLIKLKKSIEIDNKPNKNKVGIGDDFDKKAFENDKENKKDKVKKEGEFKKEQKIQENLGSISKNFCSNTSIHGLNNLASTRSHIVRFLWFLAICLFTYVTVYTAYSTTVGFLEYDVITVTKNVVEEMVVFPSFTICAPLWLSFGNVVLSTRHVSYCLFDDTRCNITNDIEDFTREKLTSTNDQYNCLRFNGYRENYTLKAKDDIYRGLVFRLNMNMSVFRFYIQDNYLNTYRSSIEYTISANETYRVYASKTVDKKLGEPYNPCTKVEDKAYRRENCLEKCIHDHVDNVYNFSLHTGYYNYNFMKIPWCKQNVTVQGAWRNSFMKPCEVVCPQECFSTDWNVAIVPGKENSNSRDTITTIEVSLSQMNHLELTQIPKTSFWDFLSSLGGTLGFLGMSFMSFIEVAEFISQIIFSFCFNF